MIDIQVSTARFRGAGSMTCWLCSTQCVFPDDCNVIIVHYAGILVVSDAASREVFHDCRRPHALFFCRHCKVVREPEAPSRPRWRRHMGWSVQPRCGVCGTALQT